MSETTSRQSTATAVQASDAGATPKPVQLNSFDDLLRAVRELLMDPRLEVSVVTPLINSLFETFIERFQVYPFDEVSLLLARLELDGFPAQGLRELIRRIEETYEKNHGEAIHNPLDALAMDNEFLGLRQSIRYAAIMAEREYQRDRAVDADVNQLPTRNTGRQDSEYSFKVKT